MRAKYAPSRNTFTRIPAARSSCRTALPLFCQSPADPKAPPNHAYDAYSSHASQHPVVALPYNRPEYTPSKGALQGNIRCPWGFPPHDGQKSTYCAPQTDATEGNAVTYLEAHNFPRADPRIVGHPEEHRILKLSPVALWRGLRISWAGAQIEQQCARAISIHGAWEWGSRQRR